MRKESFIVISFLVLINAGIVCGSNEILLKSRSFVPKRGISADTRAVIEAIPGRAHVLIQLEQVPPRTGSVPPANQRTGPRKKHPEIAPFS